MRTRVPRIQLTRRDFLSQGAGGAIAGMAAAMLRPAKARGADGGRNPFAYDVEKYRRTDPALLGYEEVGRHKSPKGQPRRMALGPEDRWYLAAGTGISVLDRNGRPVSEVACAGAVRSLGVGADGTVYAGLKDHVEVHDARGKRIAVWNAPEGRPFLTGIAVGKREVFVADSGNRIVWRHDLSGKVLGRIGGKDVQRNIPGLVLPSPYLDVELGADGLLRVNNPGRHRVELYTVEGDLEMAWGKASMGIEGFCGCCNPVNLALLADGRVVTFEKGLPRVKVYAADGAFECVVAGPESFADTGGADAIREADEVLYGGLDGVVDSTGRVIVVDLMGGTIHVMKRKPGTASAGSRGPASSTHGTPEGSIIRSGKDS